MKVFVILSVILYLTLSGNVTSSWTVSSTATANSNMYNLGTLAVGDILTVSFIFPNPPAGGNPVSFIPSIFNPGQTSSAGL